MIITELQRWHDICYECIKNRRFGVMSFIKWAGGKNQLLNYLTTRLPDMKGRGYYEPFVGSGALFFCLKERYRTITDWHINDANARLICCYEAIRDNIDELVANLSSKETIYNEASDVRDKEFIYYAMRKMLNEDKSPLNIATEFIFLNKTCYNGLYRENKKGDFNVPWGKKESVKIFDEHDLRHYSDLLQDVEITSCLYNNILETIKEGDFVYLDPPYMRLKADSFTTYSKNPFGMAEQIELSKFCEELTRRGVLWMQSNAAVYEGGKLLAQTLYPHCNIDIIKAKRSINSKGDGRGKVDEVIIKNY